MHNNPGTEGCPKFSAAPAPIVRPHCFRLGAFSDRTSNPPRSDRMRIPLAGRDGCRVDQVLEATLGEEVREGRYRVAIGGNENIPVGRPLRRAPGA